MTLENLKSVLKSLADGGWNHAHIDWFIGVLGCAPLQHMQPTGKDSSSPLGVRFHFADLWIEELLKVGGSKTETPLDSAASAKFINCWVKVATMTNIGTYFKQPDAIETIFRTISKTNSGKNIRRIDRKK